MNCPVCQATNAESAETCIDCGRSLFALTRGALLSGRYEILGHLGRGGMGTVYKANDRELDELVAVKVLRADLAQSSDAAKRFRSEIKLARKVRHENVCGIHEYGQQGHLRYIVMEFIDGVDLKQLLRQRGRFGADEAYEVAIQVAAGLQAIHNVGIVHRDLKTPNIMRDAQGHIRLMDFGIAKQMEGDTTGATATGNIVGTPEYMSPEQARAEKVDVRSDVYALGIVVYELFTGDVPFRGDTPVQTLMKHVSAELPVEDPRAQSLPPGLIPILRRALAKDRADRFGSSREFAMALSDARGLPTSGIAARTASPVPAGFTPVPWIGSDTPTTPMPAAERAAGETTPWTMRPRPVVGSAVAKETTPVPAHPYAVGAASPTPSPRDTPSTRTPSGDHAPPTFVEKPPPRVAKSAMPSRSLPTRRQAPGVGQVPSRGRFTLGLVALSCAVLAALALGAWWLLTPNAPESVARQAPALLESETSLRTPSPPSTVLGTPPSPAEIRVAPPAHRVPGKTEPRPLPSPTPPTRAVTATLPSNPVQASPGAASAASVVVPALAANPGRGSLQVGVKPYAQVIVDGKDVGTTPIPPLDLSAGPHVVRLLHPDYQPLQRKVTIRPGETQRLIVDLALDALPK